MTDIIIKNTLLDITIQAPQVILDTDQQITRITVGGGAGVHHVHTESDVTSLISDLALKAPLASPALTGVPTAPTAAPGTNTTQISTTAFVAAAVAALVNSAPGTLDTLRELADALGDDANFAATVTAALANKQPLDATLTALAGLSTTANKLIYATNSDVFSTTDLTSFARTILDDPDAATVRTTIGAGTLTSVALTVPGILSVAGSPITGAGTLAVSLVTQVANTVFAGPTSGGATAPAFRALVASDIPALSYLTSPLTTRGDLLTRDASTHIRLALGASGKFLRSDGTDPGWQLLVAGDIPNLDASKIATGTMAQARLGSGSGNTGTKFLADDQTYKTIMAGITVKEIDGAPNAGAVSVIRFPNGTVVDDGGGQVTIGALALLDSENIFSQDNFFANRLAIGPGTTTIDEYDATDADEYLLHVAGERSYGPYSSYYGLTGIFAQPTYNNPGTGEDSNAFFIGIQGGAIVSYGSRAPFLVHGLHFNANHYGDGQVAELKGAVVQAINQSESGGAAVVSVYEASIIDEAGNIGDAAWFRGTQTSVVGIDTFAGLWLDNVVVFGTTAYAIKTDGGETRHKTGSATTVALALQRAASQSADLFRLLDSDGSTKLTYFDSAGDLFLPVKTANYVFAGPSSGSAARPAFRALVATDIPDLSGTYQPLDSDLTALAALATQPFGRSLLTQASASAAQSTLDVPSNAQAIAYAILFG